MGVLQAPGRLGGLQEPPGGVLGASRKTPGPPKKSPPRTAKASNLGRGRNFTRDGQAGLGHPPWGGAGLRSGQGSGVSARGSRGGF